LPVRSPVAPPRRRHHHLKGLPVHRGVLLAGCPVRSGRQNASRGFAARVLCLQALRRPALLHRVTCRRRVKPRSHEGFLQLGAAEKACWPWRRFPVMSRVALGWQQCGGSSPFPAAPLPRHAGQLPFLTWARSPRNSLTSRSASPRCTLVPSGWEATGACPAGTAWAPGTTGLERAQARGWFACQFRDSRSPTISVAAAGDPLTKPKNGPKS
jgi:hypothetical protein